MIYGVGTDIVRIARMRDMIERFGDEFTRRIYTAEELREASGRSDPSEYFAGRWAAKEAAAKALGCGIGESCAWQDISIGNSNEGRPRLVFSGRGLATCRRKGIATVHVSVSHEHEYACATVILEKDA